MKVAYVHHCATYGGPCRSLGLLLPFLKSKGVQPHIICPEGGAANYFRKFTSNVHIVSHRPLVLVQTVVGYANTPFHFLRALLLTQFNNEIKKVLQKIQPDIVHCNEYGMIKIAKLAKSLNIPVVIHARTMHNKSYPKLNDYVIKQLDKYGDHIICISGSLANFLKDIERKSIIYNPVETIPKIGKTDIADKNKITFLSLAAFRKSKGVYEMIEAAEELIEDERIQIKIAGKVRLYNPKSLTYKQKILAFLGILNFKEAQHFLNLIESKNLKNIKILGHVDNIDTVLRECDVLLAPMRLNSPPRSVCEAGLYETPSILSMEDKIEDVIEDGVNGILIDEQSPKQLKEAMLKLANSPELRERLGKEARKRFLKINDPKFIANSVYEVYRNILP